jgi:hypothetical protein
MCPSTPTFPTVCSVSYVSGWDTHNSSVPPDLCVATLARVGTMRLLGSTHLPVLNAPKVCAYSDRKSAVYLDEKASGEGQSLLR